MRPLKFILIFAPLFFLLGPAFSADPIPADLTGQYGFDWLRPTKAKCAAVTEELRGRFKSCEYHGPKSTGSFTGKADFTSCKISPKSEYLIYKTKSRCTDELETMQANAP